MISASDFDSCPTLARLSPVELDQDCPDARQLKYAHHDVVYRQAERGQYVWCLLQGQVILSRLDADGSVVTTGLLGAGEFFGHAFGGAPEAADSATATGPSLMHT